MSFYFGIVLLNRDSFTFSSIDSYAYSYEIMIIILPLSYIIVNINTTSFHTRSKVNVLNFSIYSLQASFFTGFLEAHVIGGLYLQLGSTCCVYGGTHKASSLILICLFNCFVFSNFNAVH